MWGEILTLREVEFCRRLLTELENVEWIQPLLRQLGAADSWTYSTKPLLFELRFAAALHAARLHPQYEYRTGVGDSTVDFRVTHSNAQWLIELVCILASDAVKRATWRDGLFFGTALSTDSPDPTQSIEGELILAQQKIGEKVFTKNGPIKFPPPRPGSFHMILVDMRGFGITGGDIWDYRCIAYGPSGVVPNALHLVHSWRGADGQRRPILGLFDENNTHLRAARTFQERIHFIGFCGDHEYSSHSLRNRTLSLANPHLFHTNHEAEHAYRTYVLPPIPDQSTPKAPS